MIRTRLLGENNIREILRATDDTRELHPVLGVINLPALIHATDETDELRAENRLLSDKPASYGAHEPQPDTASSGLTNLPAMIHPSYDPHEVRSDTAFSG